MFAIITCENYKCSEAIGVIKEQERSLNVKDLSHVNYNPDLSHNNIVLEHDKNLDCFSTYRGYIENFYTENNLTGRFNINTNDDRNATKVLSSFVISGSSDFYSSFNSRDEIFDYFKSAGDFLKSEYPHSHVVDFRVHLDEKGLPHAHYSFIPIYQKDNGDRCINITQQQRGKDYFRGLQDRYYNYMREKYPDKDIQRKNPERDHDKKLSVKEYKEFKEVQREFREKAEHLQDKIDRLKDLENKVDYRDQEIKEYSRYLDMVDRYCDNQGITLYQYNKECFYADRGYGDYPAPEYYNPERDLNINHDKDINHDKERDIER